MFPLTCVPFIYFFLFAFNCPYYGGFCHLVLRTIPRGICWRMLPWEFFLHRFSKTCGEAKKRHKSGFTCLTYHSPYLPDTNSDVPCAFSLEKKPAFQAVFHEAWWELLKLTMSNIAECFKTSSPHWPWRDWGLAVPASFSEKIRVIFELLLKVPPEWVYFVCA